MTAKESLNVREGLLRMKADLLHRLVALATDRKQAESLVDQLATLEKALEATMPMSNEYGRYKSAAVAIRAYLDKVGRAQTREEIEEALVLGGWGGGEPGRTKIRQSIGSFIAGHLREAKILKEVNGKIGRHEWSKDKFA